MITVSAGHAPMVGSVKPGIITLWPMEYVQPVKEIFVSTSKGMVFVDGKIVRIVVAEATINPQESREALNATKTHLEQKMQQLKSQ